jgi:hypothetical protein
MRPAFLSALPVKRLSIPVSVGPGATALTRAHLAQYVRLTTLSY